MENQHRRAVLFFALIEYSVCKLTSASSNVRTDLLFIGVHSSIIVPPSWIVKLPRRGSFKSSLRKSPKKKTNSKKKSKEKVRNSAFNEAPSAFLQRRSILQPDQRTFVIKPIPTVSVKPVIVFINPKSGGNQGAKLLQKFQWLLNPRQVFDLTQGGPKMG